MKYVYAKKPSFKYLKEDNKVNLGTYNKTITALITGLIGWGSAVVTSDTTAITAAEWIMLATVIATALGVFSIANKE